MNLPNTTINRIQFICELPEGVEPGPISFGKQLAESDRRLVWYVAESLRSEWSGARVFGLYMNAPQWGLEELDRPMMRTVTDKLLRLSYQPQPEPASPDVSSSLA